MLDDVTKQADIAATAAGTDVPSAIAEALLSVTVCDPACGSGHFLVAAARRIAKRVAAVREHNPEPTLESLRTALRDVITRCIYGVDLNPMAVELAKVSLWLEALDPGKPLSFLDARIKHGNALIGATPKLMDEGIPDAAFKLVEGDDEKWARLLAKTNEQERAGQNTLFDIGDIPGHANTDLAAELAQIVAAPSASLHDVHRQAADYRAWAESANRQRELDIANAWCAAFMWHKTKDAPPAITYNVFNGLKKMTAHCCPQPSPLRSTGSATNTASSTGTWNSPTSSACPAAGSGDRPEHRLGRRVHSPSRHPRGTGLSSRIRSTSAQWSRRLRHCPAQSCGRPSPPGWRRTPDGPGGMTPSGAI